MSYLSLPPPERAAGSTNPATFAVAGASSPAFQKYPIAKARVKHRYAKNRYQSAT